MADWARDYQAALLVETKGRPSPEVADGMEELMKEADQNKLHEPEFVLSEGVCLPVIVEHVEDVQHKRKRKTANDEFKEWICSKQKGSAVHRNRNGVPTCQKKQKQDKAHFESGIMVVDTREQAETLVVPGQSDVCAAMNKKNVALCVLACVHTLHIRLL